MRYDLAALVALTATLASGCSYRPSEIVNPDSISLQQAVLDVAKSLHAVRDAYSNKEKEGLYTSEATVTFNISSQSTNTTGLQVAANAPAIISPIPVNLNATDQVVAMAQRGNQVTIKFKHIYELWASGAKSTPAATNGRGANNSLKCDVDNPPVACLLQCLSDKTPQPPWCKITLSAPLKHKLEQAKRELDQVMRELEQMKKK